MSKNEFIAEIISYLQDLPEDERARISEYYNEYFNEAHENGKSESETIKELDTPEYIALRVKSEFNENIRTARRKTGSIWIASIAALFLLTGITYAAYGILNRKEDPDIKAGYMEILADIPDTNGQDSFPFSVPIPSEYPDITVITDFSNTALEYHEIDLGNVSEINIATIMDSIKVEHGDTFKLGYYTRFGNDYDVIVNDNRFVLKPQPNLDNLYTQYRSMPNSAELLKLRIFVLTIPEGIEIDVLGLSSASGDIHVDGEYWSTGNTGSLSMDTASGNVSLSGFSGGDISINSASGDASVNGCSGIISVNAASGDISAVGVSGYISMNTASGDVSLSDFSDGNIDVNSVSGSANISVEGKEYAFDVTTLSGSISIQGKTYSKSDALVYLNGSKESDYKATISTVTGDIKIK